MIRSLIVDVCLRVSSGFNWLAEKAKDAAIFMFNWRRSGKVRK